MRRATADEPARSLRAKAEAESQRAGGSPAPAAGRPAGGGEYWNLVTAVAVVAWLVVLGYSALMLQPEASGRVRRVLFFPEVPYHDAAPPGTDLVLRQEVRYVPYRPRMEPSLRLLVEETILGPADHRTGHLLPASARVISTHVADAADDLVAYVNLSHHAWLEATAVPSTGAERIRTLADIILFNFPGLREVHVLIEGQEPRLDQVPNEGAEDG
jgi:hypothetical protein